MTPKRERPIWCNAMKPAFVGQPSLVIASKKAIWGASLSQACFAEVASSLEVQARLLITAGVC